MKTFNRLKFNDNFYTIPNKKKFISIGTISYEQYLASKSFAEEMAHSNHAEHRAHRSGGIKIREPKEIFKDTIRGKLGEFAFYNYLLLNNISANCPDLNAYPLGKWDDVDIEYKNKKINIKSTKKFGNLLLLEKKDWDLNGNYIPNIKSSNSLYDYFVFIRLGKIQSKENKLGFLIEFDIPGFVTIEDLKYIIKNSYVIEQNSYLNKTKMDADNYYIQASDFRDISQLIITLQSM